RTLNISSRRNPTGRLCRVDVESSEGKPMGDSSTAVTAWEALFRAQVAVMRNLSDEFPDDGISLGDYDLLFTLSRAPQQRLRIKQLHENVLLTQPSVSRLVDRLAARDLVAK